MDTLFDVDPSLYWQIPLGLLALVLAIFFLWLAFRIGKTLRSIEKLLDKGVPSLLKATEDLVGVHGEVRTLLTSLDVTITELNQKLPQLLDNINGITASVQQMNESEIRATTHNIQEITGTVNQNIAKIDGLVDTVKDASQTTIRHAEYYRDRLAGSVTGVISAWSAIKAGWEVFRGARQSHSADETPTEQTGRSLFRTISLDHS